ncbi:acid-sensing ion channel 1C-like [Oculina patagonica]
MAFVMRGNNKIQNAEESASEVQDVNTNSKSNKGRQNTPETLRSFAEDTSLHGARFLFVGNVFRRLVWTLAVTSCFCFCIYQVSQTIHAFGERPFNTKITKKIAKKNMNLTFPAVTLCNYNILNRRRYMDSEKAMNVSKEDIESKLNVYAKMLAGSKDVFNNESKKRHEELFWRFSGEAPEHIYLKAFSHQIEEMLLPSSLFDSCYINGVVCGAVNFTSFTSSLYGQCYTFNSGLDGHPVINATMAGHLNGLKLLLNIERDSYLDNPFYPFAGLTVLVHDQDTFPYMEQFGFLVQPGVRTLCAIKRKEIKSLESPFSTECNPNRSLDMFKNTRYKYSKPACLMQCLSEFVTKKCGCRPIEYEDLKFPLCAPNDTVLCMLPAYKAFGASEEMDGCEEKCTQPCEHIEYETSLSYAGLQRNVFIQKLNSSVNVTKEFPFYEHFLKMSVPEKMAYIDDNIISLDIYFQDMSFDEIVQTPVFEGWTLIANLGGNFGLFLGMSILTILEFVEYAFRRIFFLICKQ